MLEVQMFFFFLLLNYLYQRRKKHRPATSLALYSSVKRTTAVRNSFGALKSLTFSRLEILFSLSHSCE